MILTIRGKQIDLPDNLRIGVHDYKVMDRHKFKETAKYQGQCDHSLMELRIKRVDEGGNEREGSNVLVTYLHELVHAIDYVYCNYGVTNSSDGETLISGLAEGLAQVLVDNGMLVLKVDK